MVLEYVPGGTLEDRLARDGKPLPDDETRAIAAGIAAGLAHAHARGVVHRDLKPANVLFDEEGRPKLADFGIARMAVGEGTLTEAGTVLGTAAYISPEQAMGEPATPASDVYSFGVILYRMLTGRLPFESNDPMELVMHASRRAAAADHRSSATTRPRRSSRPRWPRSRRTRPTGRRTAPRSSPSSACRPATALTTAATALLAGDATQVLPAGRRRRRRRRRGATPRRRRSRSRTPLIAAATARARCSPAAALAYALTRPASRDATPPTVTLLTLPTTTRQGDDDRADDDHDRRRRARPRRRQPTTTTGRRRRPAADDDRAAADHRAADDGPATAHDDGSAPHDRAATTTTDTSATTVTLP